MRALIPAFALALAAGCASYDGRDLKAGVSRIGDVEQAMGPAAERLPGPGGETRLYYPRGRHTYVATISPEGVLRGVEQRLGYESFRKLVPNSTSAKQVRELLGPPRQTMRLPRQQLEVWEYPWQNVEELRILWAHFSPDGTLRQVIEMRDNDAYPQSGPSSYD